MSDERLEAGVSVFEILQSDDHTDYPGNELPDVEPVETPEAPAGSTVGSANPDEVVSVETAPELADPAYPTPGSPRGRTIAMVLVATLIASVAMWLGLNHLPYYQQDPAHLLRFIPDADLERPYIRTSEGVTPVLPVLADAGFEVPELARASNQELAEMAESLGYKVITMDEFTVTAREHVALGGVSGFVSVSVDTIHTLVWVAGFAAAAAVYLSGARPLVGAVLAGGAITLYSSQLTPQLGALQYVPFIGGAPAPGVIPLAGTGVVSLGALALLGGLVLAAFTSAGEVFAALRSKWSKFSAGASGLVQLLTALSKEVASSRAAEEEAKS